VTHMQPRQSKDGTVVIARRFEPSRLAGPLLSSAYETLVPVLRQAPRGQPTEDRPPAGALAPKLPAIGA
jgi:hypothetical protein